MSPLARRTQHIASFKVMELVKQAQALEAQGKPIIHLSIGEPDFDAPANVKAALGKALIEQPMRYTQATGITPLRQAIARYYLERFGVQVDYQRIIVTAGASAALTLACAALVNPDDEVLMSDPSYPCNRHFVAAFDGKPKLIPTGPHDRFQLNAKLMAQHWHEKTRGVLLATPSNPTGTSIEFSELSRCLAVVKSHDGFAIIDEIYLELTYGKKPRTVLELSQDVVVTNSFSKFFNMTGWRLGWLVVPDAWVATFEKLAQNLFICPSTLAQYAALECFTPESLALFDQRKLEFEARRNYFIPALEAIGFKVPCPPDGAFYAYVDASSFAMGAKALAQKLLHEAHVSVIPGEDFGFAEPDRYIRMSYATSREQLQIAVARMKQCLG
jgi:aspartate/methionine/tyrosine aminotransferase